MSINQLLKESAVSDLDALVDEIKSFGLLSHKADVSEIYSPPRVTALASSMGLRPGFALDLTIKDPDDGLPWDSDNPAKQAKALKKVGE